MDTVITPQTVHVNVSPLGFHRYATQFAESAAAARSKKFSPVPYFLYCRALELALKAYLLARGMSKADLKSKFGHDLCKVLAEAKKRGLTGEVTIAAGWDAEIVKANAYYNGKGFEYFEVDNAARGYPNLPNLDTLADCVSAILAGIKRT